jgi:uncharacterized protein
MTILDDLLVCLPKEPAPIQKVIIGIHWTLVSSIGCGLASSMVNQSQPGHSRVRDVGFLHQKTAQELAAWVLSDNLLEASLGMAAINSLIDVNGLQTENINAADVIIRESAGKNLAIVGHFPFIERVQPIPKNCWVIEKRPFGEDLPESAGDEFIPKADVVAITGTAFINHTIDHLLALCSPQALVMILGPSTPVTSMLFDYRVNFLSGIKVVNQDEAVITIQQGASFPQVKGVELITLINHSHSRITN